METRWTDAKLRTLKPTATRILYPVERRLWLAVEPSGFKRWIFRYKMAGKLRTLTLGEYPRLKLNEARGRTPSSWVSSHNEYMPIRGSWQRDANSMITCEA